MNLCTYRRYSVNLKRNRHFNSTIHQLVRVNCRVILQWNVPRGNSSKSTTKYTNNELSSSVTDLYRCHWQVHNLSKFKWSMCRQTAHSEWLRKLKRCRLLCGRLSGLAPSSHGQSYKHSRTMMINVIGIVDKMMIWAEHTKKQTKRTMLENSHHQVFRIRLYSYLFLLSHIVSLLIPCDTRWTTTYYDWDSHIQIAEHTKCRHFWFDKKVNETPISATEISN